MCTTASILRQRLPAILQLGQSITTSRYYSRRFSILMATYTALRFCTTLMGPIGSRCGTVRPTEQAGITQDMQRRPTPHWRRIFKFRRLYETIIMFTIDTMGMTGFYQYQ